MNINTNPPTYFAKPYESAQPRRTRRPLIDLALAITIGTLSFLTLDSSYKRNKLQEELESIKVRHRHSNDTLSKHFNNVKRQRDLQLASERKSIQMRNMKLSLHIAMLKKQLVDNNIEPKTVRDCNQEYSDSVRTESSSANITPTRFWIHNDSQLKQYIPNVREYDNA